jgi:hypothetical protein
VSNFQKYYSNLILLEDDQKEGYFCKGRGWQINLEPNPLCHTVYATTGNPANEIIIHANEIDRAQYVSDLILAAYNLYTGEILTNEPIRVFDKRAYTANEIEQQIMSGGGGTIGVYNLPISCLIAAKASQKLIYPYAIFKYLLSCRTVPLYSHALDPDSDWEPGKSISTLPGEHVLYSQAITSAYSSLEELSFNIYASPKNPSMVNGQWNPAVKHELQTRLKKGNINLSENILWHLRGTPTKIERLRKPNSQNNCEWDNLKVRDKYLDIIDAIGYASWLRSKVSAHKLSRLSRSLTIYDVANVQHLSRRLILETLGFWRYQEK